MQLWSTDLLYIGGSVAISLLGLWLVRRFAPYEIMEGHKEIAGFIYGVLGTIYAVILGFSVIFLWEQYRDGETIADREASQLSDLHRLAQALPPDQKDAFILSVEKYCKLVVDEEWPLMNQRKSSAKAHEQLLEISRNWQALNPRTEREQIILDKIVDTVLNLYDARRGRLLAARSSLPKPLWFVLIAGAGITIGFSYLFGIRSVIAHNVITIFLAASIGLGLFLIAALEGPFSGSLRLSPEAFTAAFKSWRS